jgi:hypothetical protein
MWAAVRQGVRGIRESKMQVLNAGRMLRRVRLKGRVRLTGSAL